MDVLGDRRPVRRRGRAGGRFAVDQPALWLIAAALLVCAAIVSVVGWRSRRRETV